MIADNWTIVENPAWAGVPPAGLTESDCHDRSHFIGIVCGCGEQMHIHETQIAGQEAAVIGARCKRCGGPLTFAPGVLHDAFAKLRMQGWIQ